MKHRMKLATIVVTLLLGLTLAAAPVATLASGVESGVQVELLPAEEETEGSEEARPTLPGTSQKPKLPSLGELTAYSSMLLGCLAIGTVLLLLGKRRRQDEE